MNENWGEVPETSGPTWHMETAEYDPPPLWARILSRINSIIFKILLGV